jgi:hypothetical protein
VAAAPQRAAAARAPFSRKGHVMGSWVEISFDCLPFRSVGRMDIPIDASPVYRRKLERIKAALDKHGAHNTYYLHHAQCVFHVLNDAKLGQIRFAFEGTVLTDASDERCQQCDLEVELVGDTCDWLTEPVARWFAETVSHAVAYEFDRYIAAGDLQQTRERQQQIQARCDDAGGFVGMHL